MCIYRERGRERESRGETERSRGREGEIELETHMQWELCSHDRFQNCWPNR